MQNLAHLKAAVFVDAENHPDLDVSALIKRLRQFDIVERHACADWRNRRLDRLAEQLEGADFEMYHTWSGHRPGVYKNKADSHMARNISQVLAGRPEIQVIIIVSGDEFFTHVARKLRQQGKRIIVAADPLRASKTLRNTANEYLAVGKLARWIQWLDHLERANRYLTFRFVVRKLGIESTSLAKLIRRGQVIQKEVKCPQRGTRREIYLNRQSLVVQTVLNAAL